MKDTTAGTDIGVSLVTVLKPEALIKGSWHDAWNCLECGGILSLGGNFIRPGPCESARLKPDDMHARIKCTHCGADRLYPGNGRKVIQVP